MNLMGTPAFWLTVTCLQLPPPPISLRSDGLHKQNDNLFHAERHRFFNLATNAQRFMTTWRRSDAWRERMTCAFACTNPTLYNISLHRQLHALHLS